MKKWMQGLSLIVLLSFISSGIALAQEDDKSFAQANLKFEHNLKASSISGMSFLSALKQLEDKFDISFMYKTELLEGVTAPRGIGKTDNLTYELEKLLAPFNLKYSRLNNRTFAVTFDFSKYAQKEKQKQIEQVQGTVTDAGSGDTLPGVNVLVKGTTTGTTTDAEGNFELNVPSLQDTLVFSFIGYQTTELAINGRTDIDVQLQTQAISGEELVVVGYGTQQRSDLTGSVGTVDEESFKASSPTSLQEGLSGKIAGVSVSKNSGRPGSRATIRIRGNSSITGPNDPLYVVDGVVLPQANLSNGTSPIDFLDPGNIKSIEVLKDASATAIYGARGANGVVLVTTKSPVQDGGTVSYDGSFSASKLPSWSKIGLLNSEQFLAVEDLAFQNAEKYGLAGSVVDPATKRTDPRLFDPSGNPLYDTDWQEEALRTALTNSHNLSFSGGDRNNSYTVNLGYRDEEGILKKSSLKRYSGRLNINNQINDWLTAGGTINYSVQEASQPRAVGAGGITPTRSILQALPITPVRYPNGTFGRTSDYPGMEGGAQPVRLVNETKRILDGTNTLADAFANFDLAQGLELRTTFGLSILDQETKFYAGDDLRFISDNGRAEISDEKITSWQFENYLTYETDVLEGHSFSGLLGLSWERVDNFTKFARADDFLDDYFEYNNLGIASNPRPPQSGASAHSLNSYFARINYTIDSKYLFTVTGRLDGSSRFSEDNQYAFFPSGAIGWRVSEEDFMENISTISNLKLRTSYGVTGNSEIPNYSTVTGLGNYSYVVGGARVTGVGLNQMANPNLKWEKNTQVDLGVELGLFSDRIVFEGDIYYKKSEDMLLAAPVPSTSSYSTVIRNIGSMENRGVELTLKTRNISKSNILWSTSFNISINKNKVLHLTGGQDIVQGGNPVTGNRIIREGEPVNSFYGYIQLGTWNSDEAAQAAQYNRLPGDIKYKDINSDGAINEQDRVIIGNGNPDGYGSLINNVTYKNFDLMIDIQYMYGNETAFNSRATTLDRTGITNVLTEVLDAWTPDNQDTMVPEIRPTAAYKDRLSSTGRIENGSFIRGRNIVLGYNFPSEMIQKWGNMKNVRIYASMQNFFLIDEYPGFDPEVSSFTGNFSQGDDLYSYPKPRVFQLGLSFSL